MARYAVIDVGTNSVKLHIGERRADGHWLRVADRGVVTRLGEGLPPGGGLLSPAASERTLRALADLAAEAQRAGVQAVAAVGTMALRTASNGAGFVAEVERQTQLRIEVLSGEEESRLACLAVASGLGLAPGTIVIFDTGGGSTQFTFARGAAVLNRLSVSVGAVRVMEAHRLEGAVTRANLQQALDAVAAELACLDGLDRPEVLVGMGGGVVTLAAVMFGLTHYDPDRIQGAVLPRAEVWRQIELYRSRPTELRRQIPGLQPQRAEVILAGACIIWTILKKLRKTSLTVSDRGLRHGVLVDRFGTYTGRQK